MACVSWRTSRFKRDSQRTPRPINGNILDVPSLRLATPVFLVPCPKTRDRVSARHGAVRLDSPCPPSGRMFFLCACESLRCRFVVSLRSAQKKGRRGCIRRPERLIDPGAIYPTAGDIVLFAPGFSYRFAILATEIDLTETKRSPLDAIESLISRLGSWRSVRLGSRITATVAAVATVAAMASTITTAIAPAPTTVATIAMAAAATATPTAGPTTTVAVVASRLTTTAVTCGVTTVATVATMSRLGFAVAAKQSDSDHRDKDRDAIHQCSIHPRILQSTSTVASGNRNTCRPPNFRSTPAPVTAIEGVEVS